MTSISYTPEMQDLQPFLQVAKDLGRRIESEIEDLVAPEVERPIHGNAMLELPEGLVAVAASDPPLPTVAPPGIIEGAELTVDDAAALLGVQPRTVRRRIRRKTLPARRALDHNGRLVQVVSAEAVDREPQPDAGRLTLSEAAELLGLGYATLYQRAAIGTLASHRDPDTGRLTVDRAEIGRALADQDRESLIRERSVTLLEAAALADCGHSLIRYWLRTGRVRPDPDTRPDDITYVLRCDVEQAALELKAQRGQTGKRQPGTPDGLVPLPDAQRLTGHGRRQIQQLVATGDLVRRDYRKRFHVERESLDAYIARSAPS